MLYDWTLTARPSQLPPSGPWDVWLIQAGRGFGKTRTGAQETIRRAELVEWILLVGETAADARDVMIEGESGIIACSPPWFMPLYEPSKRRLTWPNGCTALICSGDDPDQLRGPQGEFAWVDELAKMRYAAEAWSNLDMAMRLGENPQVIVTTTPRPLKLLREIVADPGTITTRGSYFENAENVAEKWAERLVRRYEGTRRGRQELHGELLDEDLGALWSITQLDTLRVRNDPPEMSRVCVALDPAVTDPNKPELNDEPDEWGITVQCIDKANRDDAHGYVLEDGSGLYSPTEALYRAVEAYNTWDADIMIGEVNNGGDFIEALLRTVPNSAHINYKAIRASRGKMKRAEPISGLYEQGRCHHVGSFATLEDEMTTYTGLPGEDSPNRMDALVWGFSELMLVGIEGGEVELKGI